MEERYKTLTVQQIYHFENSNIIMRNKIIQEILDSTPKDVEIFVEKYARLVIRINSILKEKGFSKKQLAEGLSKKPSEITKWLNGNHNFTLRSIAKLEAELGETLLEVPERKTGKNFIHSDGTTKFTVYVSAINKPDHKPEWKPVLTEQNQVAYV